jgi:hypothetical protein
LVRGRGRRRARRLRRLRTGERAAPDRVRGPLRRASRRIGVEAAQLFQRLLLRELGFHRVELQIYAFNERAIAHAERAGYVREGVKRRAYLKDGEWVDAVLYALTQEDLD